MKAVGSSFHSILSGNSDPSPYIGTSFIAGSSALSLTFPLDGRHRFSERAVQSVVVVFEVLQLQEVPGPLAALLHRRCEVGGLGGGGGGASRLCGAGQVFGCGLVVLARSAAAAAAVAVRLDAESRKGRNRLFAVCD